MSRIYAWEICRALFGRVEGATKIRDTRIPEIYQTRLLQAGPAPLAEDIVRIRGLVHYRALLLATNALSVLHYVSPPTAPLMSAKLRDALRTAQRGPPRAGSISRAAGSKIGG